MKQTVRTSRTAGQLEKMFRAINAHFYNNELPEPIITLKKTPNAYGHITCSKTWQAGSERRYEINISTATLDRPIEETTATLCHECAHLYAMTHGIKDTSGAGNSYHNKRFKAIAEAHGLIIDHPPAPSNTGNTDSEHQMPLPCSPLPTTSMCCPNHYCLRPKLSCGKIECTLSLQSKSFYFL